MRKRLPTMASALTEWEWHGLERRFNLADGHAHQDLPAEMTSVLDGLPRLILNRNADQERTESEFTTAFFEISGQRHPMVRPFLHLSSSISIELAAKALKQAGNSQVGLISPSFDNIPQLLRRSGLVLHPIPEHSFWADDRVQESFLSACDALFLVVPNNPTGYTPSDAALQQ